MWSRGALYELCNGVRLRQRCILRDCYLPGLKTRFAVLLQGVAEVAYGIADAAGKVVMAAEDPAKSGLLLNKKTNPYIFHEM
jgi:hypothetical protein